MSVPKRIAFNTIFSSTAKISWTLIALIALGLVTRHLGIQGFGEYTTILAFYFMLSALVDLGLNHIVLREISYREDEEKETKTVSLAFTIRMLMSLLMVLLAGGLVWFLPYSLEVKKGILLVSVGLFFSSGYQILAGVFQKRLLAYWVSAAELLGRAANLFWVFLCVKFGADLLWVLGGMIASWFTTFIIVYILAKKKIGLKLEFSFSGSKKLIKSALPLGISAVVTFLYFRLDTIILSVMKGSVDVGIYGAAYKIVENVSYFPAMFMGLVMPLWARYIFSDRKKFSRVADRTFDAISIIAIGVAGGIYSLAPKVIAIIAGAGFEASVVVLRILSVAIVGLFFAQYFNMMLIAAKKQKQLLKVFLFCAVFNIGANFIFIGRFSYLAAAVISSITEILVPILGFVLVIKYCKYRPRLLSFLKVLAAGAIMMGFLFLTEKAPIYLQIVLGGGIYLLFSYFMGAFSREDFKKIISAR
ncbi:MAG: flippase [Patescibacteria group bacterium]|nr:flippase [Patescibacteria group bacterium]